MHHSLVRSSAVALVSFSLDPQLAVSADPQTNTAPNWHYGLQWILAKVSPQLPADDGYCGIMPCDKRCPRFEQDRLLSGDAMDLSSRDTVMPGDFESDVYNSFTLGKASPDKFYKAQGCSFPDIENDLDKPGAFTEQTTDCLGNPLPSGVKFYKPFPKFETLDRWPGDYVDADRQKGPTFDEMKGIMNAYVKDDVAYHFPPGQFKWDEAHNYCNSLGLSATHLWCPGSMDEIAYVWVYHPEQPIQENHFSDNHDWSGYVNRGMWTGINRHLNRINNDKSTDDAEYYCGGNRTYQWYDQEFLAWKQGPKWRLGPNDGSHPQGLGVDPSGGPRGVYTSHYRENVMLGYLSPDMSDMCWHGSPTKKAEVYWERGAIVCEMNCDLVNVDPIKPEDPDACSTDCEYLCYRGECVCESCYETARPDGTCKPLSQIESDIPVDNAIPEILNLIPEEITPEEIAEITMHGCHCAKLGSSGGNGPHLGGALKVDEMDEVCNKWNQGRRCVTLPGGQCEGQDLSGLSYKFGLDPAARSDCVETPEGYPISWTTEALKSERSRCFWFYYPSVAYDCSLESDPCLKAICEIDGKWVSELIKAFRDFKQVDDDFKAQKKGSFVGNIVSDGTCEACEDNCFIPSSCQGSAPDLFFGK